jgi:hypothetical protein
LQEDATGEYGARRDAVLERSGAAGSTSCAHKNLPPEGRAPKKSAILFSDIQKRNLDT